jgi:Ser/Thr protein kinase RdoA (MazF antagonist)
MTGPPVATAAQSTGTTGGAHDVVAGRSSPEDVCRFLTEVVPLAVSTALTPLLPDGVGPLRAAVTRAKLKPGRKLTVSLDLSGDGITGRPATATWGPASTPPAVPDAPLSRVTPALRAPFSTLVPPRGRDGLSLLLAPLDPAFPQLVDAYDPAHMARLVAGAGVAGFEEGARVTALRYRPGQRHVLLVESRDGRHRLFAKCYRDSTGEAAVQASRLVAQALSSARAPARTVRLAAYAPTGRLVLWEAEDATPLSRALRAEGAWTPAQLAHVGRAGAVLRALHEGAAPTSGAPGDGRSDPVAEGSATRRSVEHVTALAPRAGAELDALLVDTVTRLADLPAESGHLLHGDYKCDNVLVDGDDLVLLDFDRVTTGDPAVELGKFVADLRWWARAARLSPTALVDAFLYGYGPCPPTRVARALHYDVVFQLRALGRRVPLHEPGWAEAVDGGLDTARVSALECTHEAARQTHRVLGARAR